MGFAVSFTSTSVICRASALTSHGCPAVSSNARKAASGKNTWPVSSVCWPNSSATSARVKLRMVNDSALMLKGLAVPSRPPPPAATL